MARLGIEPRTSDLQVSWNFITKSNSSVFLYFKGRFLLFQVYRNFANLFFKLSVSIFYHEISKF